MKIETTGYSRRRIDRTRNRVRENITNCFVPALGFLRHGFIERDRYSRRILIAGEILIDRYTSGPRTIGNE